MKRNLEEGDIISSKKLIKLVVKTKSVKRSINHKLLGKSVIRTLVPEEGKLEMDSFGYYAGGIGFFETITSLEKKGLTLREEKMLKTRRKDVLRGTARFLVEKTAFDGGGTGHGPHDIYPDGDHIWIRRLKVLKGKDKEILKYDPKGETTHFYTSGCSNCFIELKDIKYHGKMKKTTTWEKI